MTIYIYYTLCVFITTSVFLLKRIVWSYIGEAFSRYRG